MRGPAWKFQYEIWSDDKNPADRVELETSNRWWDTEEKARSEALIAADLLFSSDSQSPEPVARVVEDGLESDGVSAFRVKVERWQTYRIEIVEIPV